MMSPLISEGLHVLKNTILSSAPQVYNLHDPYYSSSNSRPPAWTDGHRREEEHLYESKDDGHVDDNYNFETPRPPPPPPAPTPMPPSVSVSTSDSVRPMRLRQSWGGSASPRDGSSSSSGGGSSGDGSGAFVAPSKLQEASLWSTAVEQAALERRMREVSTPHHITSHPVSIWRSTF